MEKRKVKRYLLTSESCYEDYMAFNESCNRRYFRKLKDAKMVFKDERSTQDIVLKTFGWDVETDTDRCFKFVEPDGPGFICYTLTEVE